MSGSLANNNFKSILMMSLPENTYETTLQCSLVLHYVVMFWEKDFTCYIHIGQERVKLFVEFTI